MVSLTTVIVFLILGFITGANGFYCRNVLQGTSGRTGARQITSDVFVGAGQTCRIQGNVIISGSLTAGPGSSLVTGGNLQVNGGLFAAGSRSVVLNGGLRVLGVVSLSNVQNAYLGPAVNLGSVSGQQVGLFNLHGAVASLSLSSSRAVNVNPGAKVFMGGINIERAIGNVRLCGANIRGGVRMIESKGSLLAPSSCRKTDVTGPIFFLNTVGNLRLEGTKIHGGDLNIGQVQGNVVVHDAIVSDIGLTEVKGNVNLRRVKTDSDTVVSGITGNLQLLQADIKGDFSITRTTGSVTVRGSNFNNEMVNIGLSGGPVVFSNNRQFSATVNENKKGVTFTNNRGRGASIGSNAGPVTVSGNTLTGLSCVDNVQTPVGAGNRVPALTRSCGRVTYL